MGTPRSTVKLTEPEGCEVPAFVGVTEAVTCSESPTVAVGGEVVTTVVVGLLATIKETLAEVEVL
jgi:hypothetical protein